MLWPLPHLGLLLHASLLQRRRLHKSISPAAGGALPSFGTAKVGTAGGICSLSFSADQLDAATEEGRKANNSLFNWCYFSFTVSMMVVLTVVVYVQDSVSWSLGLAIPQLSCSNLPSFSSLEPNFTPALPKGQRQRNEEAETKGSGKEPRRKMEEEKGESTVRHNEALHCSMRCFCLSAPAMKPEKGGDGGGCDHGGGGDEEAPREAAAVKKYGGWKSMPFVIGNETFEKLAAFGLMANFMVYLVNKFKMKQVYATNVLNIFSGTANLAPLAGAYLADAHLGRFRTLALASFASLAGMVVLTLTALLPQLRPPECSLDDAGAGGCDGPSRMHLGVLFTALALLTIGAGGIRPCNVAFAVDQFDAASEKGRKDINTFFNWYYFSFTISMMVALTLVVYIQDSVSWSLGLGIPALLMIFSIIVFFLGTKMYVMVEPEGSVFTSILQVLVACYRKRHLDVEKAVYFDPPSSTPKYDLTANLSHFDSEHVVSIIGTSSTTPFQDGAVYKNDKKFLNKAAIMVSEAEITPEGSAADPWRLSSVQKVEELKCLVGIFPIWIAGVLCFIPAAQQGTFSVLQALKMDRHLGTGSFQIPPGSLGVFSLLAVTLWIPIYDRLIVPAARSITNQEEGITLLQRTGIGLVLSVLSMLVSAMVERKRIQAALLHPDINGVAPISVLWLVPQCVILGIAEAFYAIGQIEFYYKEFPDHMTSFSGSLLNCAFALSSYLTSLLVSLVRSTTATAKSGGKSWLEDDINRGRVDYYYYLLAVLGGFNLLYFLIVSSRYEYKATARKTDVKIMGAQKGEDEDGKENC
ncbi:NRT1-PTR FAMILY 2-13 protein [Nymphaea thermarum]|nr:NRT1-PTR FAMILY 2-13 protein [Nymphaea thermarum]